MGTISFHIDQSDDPPPAWVLALSQQLTTILTNQEKIMAAQTVHTDTLVAIAARLKADDDAALALLQTIRDQNVALAAQLAALPAATDPASQAIIDAAVASLTDTATAVEASVAANPAVANLPPASAPAPASTPAADGTPPAAAPDPAAPAA